MYHDHFVFTGHHFKYRLHEDATHVANFLLRVLNVRTIILGDKTFSLFEDFRACIRNCQSNMNEPFRCLALVVAQWWSTHLVMRRSWVRFQVGAGLFSSSIFSNFLNQLIRSVKRSISDCVLRKKKMDTKLCCLGQNKLRLGKKNFWF